MLPAHHCHWTMANYTVVYMIRLPLGVRAEGGSCPSDCEWIVPGTIDWRRADEKSAHALPDNVRRAQLLRKWAAKQ